MAKLQKKTLQAPNIKDQAPSNGTLKERRSLFRWRSKSRIDLSSDISPSPPIAPPLPPNHQRIPDVRPPAPVERALIAPPRKVVATGGLGELEDMQRVARMLDEENPEPNDDHEAYARHAARTAAAGAEQITSGTLRPTRTEFPSEPDNASDPSILSNLHLPLARLPPSIWTQIHTYLSPLSAANLALTSKLLRYRLGALPWQNLTLPQNSTSRLAFLLQLDPYLPHHLLCHPCLTYHARLSPSTEQLYASYALHPVFLCPNALHKPLPKTRLTPHRHLPFHLVQLALRAHRFSPAYGIPLSALARSWRDADSQWSHRSRFHIHPRTGHLLMRLSSSCPADPNLTASEQRLLLFSRTDYTPYFSVCAHWADGALIPLAKCALSHVPGPGVGIKEQMRQNPGKTPEWGLRKADLMPRGCEECRCLRRCAECPTEYLVEVKMVEDRGGGVIGGARRKSSVTTTTETRRGSAGVPAAGSGKSGFRHALCVTRWSDLGDGRAPSLSREWRAINGELVGSGTAHFKGFGRGGEGLSTAQGSKGEEEEEEGKGYDSFAAIGNATLCSHFEAAISNGAPNQRVKSLSDWDGGGGGGVRGGDVY